MNMWYLQIWFWTIERVVNCVYVVLCYVENTGLRDDWKKYTSKHDVRKIFQIGLGIGLMEYGICLDWGDVCSFNGLAGHYPLSSHRESAPSVTSRTQLHGTHLPHAIH